MFVFVLYLFFFLLVFFLISLFFFFFFNDTATTEIYTLSLHDALPITFPESLDQHPRPQLPGMGTPWGTPTRIEYKEGAEIGHRWFAKTGAKPLYAFGHGLSYTSFEYSDLSVDGGETIIAKFTVTNTGNRSGADVPQLYLTSAPDGKRLRLLGSLRDELAPAEKSAVTMSAARDLLARGMMPMR